MSLSYLQQDTPKSNLDIRVNSAVVDGALTAGSINGSALFVPIHGGYEGLEGTGLGALTFSVFDFTSGPVGIQHTLPTTWTVQKAAPYFMHFQGFTEVPTDSAKNLNVSVKINDGAVYSWAATVDVGKVQQISFSTLLSLNINDVITIEQSGDLAVNASADNLFFYQIFAVGTVSY